MAQLNIPAIGDELVLLEDWEANIYDEHRNHKFVTNLLGLKEPTWRRYYDLSIPYQKLQEDPEYQKYSALHEAYTKARKEAFGDKKIFKCVIPKGTVLVVDRIYIRNGCVDFNSVTFRAKKVKGSKIHGRFWVKLATANEIEYEMEKQIIRTY